MSDIAVVVSFGGGAILVFAALYAFYLNGHYKLVGRELQRAQRNESSLPSSAPKFPFSITFARLYGLIVVAVAGALLAFSNVNSSLATAAFTLLGTVAGYLAGASPTIGNPAPGGAPNPDVAGQGDGDAAEQVL